MDSLHAVPHIRAVRIYAPRFFERFAKIAQWPSPSRLFSESFLLAGKHTSLQAVQVTLDEGVCRSNPEAVSREANLLLLAWRHAFTKSGRASLFACRAFQLRASGQDSHPRFTLCFAGSSEPLTLLYTESLQAVYFQRFALPNAGFSAIFTCY